MLELQASVSLPEQCKSTQHLLRCRQSSTDKVLVVTTATHGTSQRELHGGGPWKVRQGFSLS